MLLLLTSLFGAARGGRVEGGWGSQRREETMGRVAGGGDEIDCMENSSFSPFGWSAAELLKLR